MVAAFVSAMEKHSWEQVYIAWLRVQIGQVDEAFWSNLTHPQHVLRLRSKLAWILYYAKMSPQGFEELLKQGINVDTAVSPKTRLALRRAVLSWVEDHYDVVEKA